MKAAEELKKSYEIFLEIQKNHEQDIIFPYKLLFVARDNRLSNAELLLAVKNSEGESLYFHEGDYRPEIHSSELEKDKLMVFNMIRRRCRGFAEYHGSLRAFMSFMHHYIKNRPELMQDSEYAKYYALLKGLCQQTDAWPHHRYIEYIRPL